MNPYIELVTSKDGQHLAYIIKAQWRPTATEFITPHSSNLQIGMIVYGKGQTIKRHAHLPIVRQVHGTNEVVSVRNGDCVVDIYDNQHCLVGSRRLTQGDIVVLIGGGHGFRINADTILFEVKQGPYTSCSDKEYF